MSDGFSDDDFGDGDDGRGLGGKRAPRQAVADQRAIRAVHLRIVKSYSYQQIADDLGLASAGAAHAAYKRGVLLSVPREEIDEARQVALQKLDAWEQLMLDVFNTTHVTVSFGKVIYNERTGEPLEDDAPKMQAMDRIIKIERERRAIIGYTAPNKRVLEVITEDSLEKAIREYNEQADALERDAQLRSYLPDGEEH